jgi:hypothetical protein
MPSPNWHEVVRFAIHDPAGRRPVSTPTAQPSVAGLHEEPSEVHRHVGPLFYARGCRFLPHPSLVIVAQPFGQCTHDAQGKRRRFVHQEEEVPLVDDSQDGLSDGYGRQVSGNMIDESTLSEDVVRPQRGDHIVSLAQFDTSGHDAEHVKVLVADVVDHFSIGYDPADVGIEEQAGWLRGFRLLDSSPR